MLIVVLAHERDRGRGGHAIEDGQAGKGCSGTPVAASAGDLNPLRHGALPGFGQREQCGGRVGGQAEVRPAEPSRFPGDGRRLPVQQVDAESWPGAVGQWAAEGTASHQPPGRKAHDARR
jgi:hypothetical protein